MGLGQGLLGQIGVVRPPGGPTLRRDGARDRAAEVGGMRPIPPGPRARPGRRRWSARPARISGRVRRSRRGPRQSNDCTMILSAAPCASATATTASAIAAPSTARSGCQGNVFSSMLKRRQRIDAQHIAQRRNRGAVMRHLVRMRRRHRRCRGGCARRRSRPVPLRAASGSPAPGAASQAPFLVRVMSGLSRGSCVTTTTSSAVTATSSSSASTPIASAPAKPASVFSGNRPRAPRWPCKSIVCIMPPRRSPPCACVKMPPMLQHERAMSGCWACLAAWARWRARSSWCGSRS